MSGSDSGAQRQTSIVALRTPAAGVALTNGTPTLATFTTPNDGNPHAYTVGTVTKVTVAETGGQVVLQWTSGGTAQSTTISGGTQGVGAIPFGSSIVADPNTAISIVQATALTAGAASVIAAINGQ